MMKLNKKIVLAVVLVVGLGVLIVFLFRWARSEDRDTIHFSGNIELTRVDIAFKIPGRLVERTVDEGDAVKKGMVMARLDREQLLRQRDREKAALASAESQLTQLQTSIAYQRETLEGQIAQHRAELSQAEAGLKTLLAGSRPQEIEQARASVDSAKTEFERAKKDWDRAQILIKNDDISTSQYDQFRTRFESASAALKQAQERLALVLEGPRKEDIEAARAQVARAKAGLQLAEATRLELKRREQERETRRAEIDRSRATLGISESQLEDTVAVSPIDGVVMAKAAEVGETVAAGTTVVTVGDIEHPWLRGYISEKDLGRVKLGDKVKVTTDSFPGKVYWGRVGFISSEAEFTPKQIQTPEERVKLVYRIKIDIPNPQHELKLNMPADAVILPNQ